MRPRVQKDVILTEVPHQVFDRQAVRRHKERAGRDFGSFDFLLREAADRLVDRLADVRRTFPVAVELGAHQAVLQEAACGRSSLGRVLHSAGSEAMLTPASTGMVADEELLPFASESLDLIISSCALHWVNDVPGTLIQARQALKPDGLFLANFFGGETLKELRDSLLKADMEVEGGAGPRVSPFADIRDAGALLQRAGFALPVADTEILTVSYDNPLKLLYDLRGMGESSAISKRRKTFSRRATLFRACEIYLEDLAGDDGRVPATFELITLTGWAPAESQPKAAARGSGQLSLTDVLEADTDKDP